MPSWRSPCSTRTMSGTRCSTTRARKAEADKATAAALMSRRLTVDCEHRARGHAIDERERLRQQALRACTPCRRYVVSHETHSATTPEPTPQLINEARAALDARIAN